MGPALLATAGGSAGHVADLVLAAGWAWAALAFRAGLAGNRKTESAALASASLITAVIAYYLVKPAQGDFLKADVHDHSGRTQVSWYTFWSMTVAWCVVACVTGPLLGLAGNLARDHGLRGLPFRAMIPLVAIVDTSQRLQFDGSPQGQLATTTWSVIRLVAVSAVVVLAGLTATTWRSRRSAG